jgi:hypothetical protein
MMMMGIFDLRAQRALKHDSPPNKMAGKNKELILKKAYPYLFFIHLKKKKRVIFSSIRPVMIKGESIPAP